LSPADGLAPALDPPPVPTELLGPQQVDVFVHRALAENRQVQAAWHDVQALCKRIPQATALDDPVFMGTIFPIPGIAPQYSIMGYMPFMYTLSQQYPWFGTLRLRGQVADREVKMALARLAAAQLEAAAEVKRAYFELYLTERTEEILRENRRTAAEVAELARLRAGTEGSQQDLYRAEVALAEIDRELVSVRQGRAEATADLAEVLHISPEADLRTLARLPQTDVPQEVGQLYRLAAANRPELKERLAAIDRDQREVELARKRYYPNITLGLEQWQMTRDGAVSPTANGINNFGLVVGFNLPVYRHKLDAGVQEAHAKTLADARRYDADRDRTNREVKSLVAQARAQRELLELLQESILPKSQKALELAAAAYPSGQVDYVTLNTGRLELLNIELQIARLHAEQGKTLAALERVVGVDLSAGPSEPTRAIAPNPAVTPPTPPSPTASGPFQLQRPP
jgi:outer membrane protein, heavy metal efflux system